MKTITIQYYMDEKYQEIESFGMSTAWWGKQVGAWKDEARSVMKQFYDKEDGIGLTNIRYNIGAGSLSSTNIIDQTRQTESFEISPGKYDFSRDNHTLFLLDLAMEYGCKEMVFFSISPPARMTYSNRACGSSDPEHPSNHLRKYYQEYATYILDIVTHFLNKNYPIKFVSPINEPQWKWGVESQTQEGCYYEKEEVADLYEIFINEINKRDIPVILSGHEGGEWITAMDYANEMFDRPVLMNHMPQLDCHSYWTSDVQKRTFITQFKQKYPNKNLVMSEWCEMKGGGFDYGMDSAFVLANTIHEDLTILDVVSWQYWTGCEQEKYQHKVALMYIKPEQKRVVPTKKLYALGQYSKFVRPGSIRIKEVVEGGTIIISSYSFQNKIVSVIINEAEDSYNIEFSKYNVYKFYITDDNHNIEQVAFDGIIPKRSICTVILKEE